MATRMQQRRGTAAQWTAANPVLAAGEIGFETDTIKFKLGNGSSAWTALKYFVDAEAILGGLSGVDLPATLDTLNELAAAMGDDPAFLTTIATNLSNHSSTQMSVHGVADMTALATTTNVSTAVATEVSNRNTAIATHSSDTTDVHGIANTANLALLTDLTTHQNDTTSIHGIVDTANLALLSDISTEVSNRNTAIATHSSDTTDVHGIADTSLLATKAYADSAVGTETTNRGTAISAHNSDTTDVHGIANTASLALLSDVTTAVGTETTNRGTAISAHNSDTTDVHGIADTSLLATKAYADNAVTSAEVDQSLLAGTGLDWNSGDERFDIDSTVATKTYADNAVSTHDSDTTNVHGIADTSALALTATVNTALDLKASLASPTFTGTVSGITKSMVGLGSVDNTTDAAKPVSTAAQTALDLKASLASPTFTGTVSGITKSMVGLGSVDNTTDAGKPVSTATQTALDLKANLASPTLTGTPLAPTAATGTNTTQVATTGFVQQELSILTTGAPALLNTLDELAAALGDDANYAATVTTALSTKAPLASPTFTGTVSGITKSMVGLGSVDNTSDAAKPVSTAQQTALDLKANLASPTFTGTNTVANITVSGTSNMSANGVQFSDGTQTKEGVASRTPIVQKTAAYTLSALTERDSLIEVSSATGVTITIPTNTAVAYPIGTSIDILQTGAGQVTIAPVDGTVTVNSTPGLKLRTTWSSATLFKRAANTWVVFGDLTA